MRLAVPIFLGGQGSPLQPRQSARSQLSARSDSVSVTAAAADTPQHMPLRAPLPAASLSPGICVQVSVTLLDLRRRPKHCPRFPPRPIRLGFFFGDKRARVWAPRLPRVHFLPPVVDGVCFWHGHRARQRRDGCRRQAVPSPFCAAFSKKRSKNGRARTAGAV